MLAIPTGWRVGGEAIHPVLLTLLKKEDNSYSLSVVNAGADGLEYHPMKPDHYSAKMLYSTSIRCDGIPSHRVEDAAFWYMVLKLILDKGYGKEEDGKAVLYERLLSFLNGKALMANVTGAGEDCDWSPCQPDTGHFSPGALLMEAIRHCARLCGMGPLQAKYVTLLLKYKICRLIELDLGTAEQLNDSDLTIIRIACRQVAALASEFTSEGGVCPSAQLYEVKQALEALEARVKGMQRVQGPTLPPELALTSVPSVPWAACFPLWGRLRRDTSVEHLIGQARVRALRACVGLVDGLIWVVGE